MPRTVVLRVPGTGEEVEYVVPDDWKDWQVKLRHIWENPGEHAKDWGKSAAAGAGVGVAESLQNLVDLPLRPLKAGAEVAARATGLPAAAAVADTIGGQREALAKTVAKGEKAIGLDYAPETNAGRYIHSGARGAASALSKSPWDIGVGLTTGLATEAAQDADLGVGGATAAAFGIPLLGMLTKNFRPSVEGRYLAKKELVNALGNPRKDPRVASEVAAARQTSVNASARGVPLLPGQSFGPHSPMAGLQERITPADPGLQRALTAQASTALGKARDLANQFAPGASTQDAATVLTSGMQRLLERRQSLVKAQTDPLYTEGGREFLTRPDAITAARRVEKVPENMQLASRSSSARLIDTLARQIRENSRSQVEVGGKPSTLRRTLVNGQAGTAGKPATPPTLLNIDNPVDTYGKLLNVRQEARTGLKEVADVKDVARAQAVEAINSVLHQNPKIKAADQKFGDLTERLVRPVQEQGPSSIALRAGTPPSPDVIDSALDVSRFGPREVGRTVKRAEAAVPGTSEMILGSKLREILGRSQSGTDLAKVTNETAGKFAGRIGLPGTPERTQFITLLEQAAKRNPRLDVGQTMDTANLLSRTGIGRGTVGMTQQPGLGAAVPASTVARALGTSPMLAAVPVLGNAARREAVGNLGQALSDPSFRKLDDLLKVNPLTDRLAQALRVYLIGAGQAPEAVDQ